MSIIASTTSSKAEPRQEFCWFRKRYFDQRHLVTKCGDIDQRSVAERPKQADVTP